MVLWGGLRPIVTRLVLDVFTLSLLSIACVAPPHGRLHRLALVVASVLTLATAGFTNRWTIAFPMVPLLVLQGLRSLIAPHELTKGDVGWIPRILSALSVLVVVVALLLSMLFPAVKLPPVHGPYNVGVVDFFLPVDLVSSSSTASANATCGSEQLPVRLFYPTLENAAVIPYLTPETAIEFCRQSMRFGAPPPLKEYGWLLHTWRLTGLRARRNATLIPGNSRLPVVLFSHGLGGNADVYSYQTMALAAHGSIVLLINHQDGSAPVVRRANGSVVVFDRSVGQIWADGKHVEYVRTRRQRTDQRVDEMIAAAESFLKRSEMDTLRVDDESCVFFAGRLQTNVTFMGHSFGGATALTAAKRRPDLVKSVIAHEPAVDWMPDDARRSLLSKQVLEGLPHSFTGGTGGFEQDETSIAANASDIHELHMLILYSHEWRQKSWGFSDLLEDIYIAGRLGSGGHSGPSALHVIEDAHHNEFSDTCMLTPVWLGRGVGLTGKRNPISTAKEIADITRSFHEHVQTLG